MSDSEHEMVERLRRTYEALNRADFDGATKILHREIEFVRPGGLPTLRGADVVRAWVEPDALEDQQWEPLEFRVRDRKVLVRQRVSARGASSGIEVDLVTFAVWTFDELDRVIRVEAFFLEQEAEALEDAGLSA